MGAAEDAMLARAAQLAMNPQLQQIPAQPQQQQRGIPFEHVMHLVSLGVITQEQCFDLIFKGVPLTEYKGPGSEPPAVSNVVTLGAR